MFAYVAAIFALVFACVGALASASGAFDRAKTVLQTTSVFQPSGGTASEDRVLRVGGYELRASSLPRHLGQATNMSVRLLRGGQSVDGARVRVTFSMPDMPGMRGLSRLLPRTRTGLYAHTSPVLTSGRWRLSFEITLRHGRSLAVGFVYRVGD